MIAKIPCLYLQGCLSDPIAREVCWMLHVCVEN